MATRKHLPRTLLLRRQIQVEDSGHIREFLYEATINYDREMERAVRKAAANAAGIARFGPLQVRILARRDVTSPCAACEGKKAICLECNQPWDACGCPEFQPTPCLRCQGTGDEPTV